MNVDAWLIVLAVLLIAARRAVRRCRGGAVAGVPGRADELEREGRRGAARLRRSSPTRRAISTCSPCCGSAAS